MQRYDHAAVGDGCREAILPVRAPPARPNWAALCPTLQQRRNLRPPVPTVSTAVNSRRACCLAARRQPEVRPVAK